MMEAQQVMMDAVQLAQLNLDGLALSEILLLLVHVQKFAEMEK